MVVGGAASWLRWARAAGRQEVVDEAKVELEAAWIRAARGLGGEGPAGGFEVAGPEGDEAFTLPVSGEVVEGGEAEERVGIAHAGACRGFERFPGGTEAAARGQGLLESGEGHTLEGV